MARMIPPYFSQNIQSTGERMIFNYFKTDPGTKNWIVLHSLTLTKHIKRLYGEIDFVIMAPNLGIFCLEVKSGNVTRDKGIWKFTNRFGESNTSTRSPFEQAQEGMYSLKAGIKRKFGENSDLNRLVFSIGVLFPHVLFDIRGLDFEHWQVYDRDSRKNPISHFINTLSKNTIRKVRNTNWFHPENSLPDENQIDRLVEFIRGDFEKIVPLSHRVTEIENEINNYTSEQIRCLDQLQGNDRCLFIGAAGTGKTLIAIESAHRALSLNKSVLFTCFNRLLADWLKYNFVNTNDITVSNFHNLLFHWAGKTKNFDYNDEFFKVELPLLALENIDKGIIDPFDFLIVDEGQDLLSEEYLDVLDSLLIGGLSGGNWNIFCDLGKQILFNSRSKDEILSELHRRTSFAQFNLSINCRNTKPIGKEISLLTQLKEGDYLPSKIEGASVQYYFSKSREDKKRFLEKTIIGLLKNKINPNRITLLSPRSFNESVVSKLNYKNFEFFDLTNSSLENIKEKSIMFSTIQGYKGLENTYVILVDIFALNDDELASLLYVGMSRAMAGLILVLDERLKESYQRLLIKGRE